MNIKRIVNPAEIYDNDQVAKLLMLCIASPTYGKVQSIAQATYSKNQGFFYVATEEDQVVGIIGGREIDGISFQLKHIAVVESHRKQGIAKELIDHLIHARSFKTLEAEATPALVDFYRATGFRCREIENHPLDLLAYKCVWKR